MMPRPHSTIVTGHGLVEPQPMKPALEFVTDTDTVAKCRDAISTIAQARQVESRQHLVHDTSFERGHMYIGACTNDAAWVDDQWASVPPEVYTEAAEALATDNAIEFHRIFKDAMAKVAHREAERKFRQKF